MGAITRRTFLKSSTAAGVTAASWNRILGANDAVRVAVVGFNGRGKNHITAFGSMPDVRLAVLCDADRDVLEREANKLRDAGKSIDCYQDFRKVIEKTLNPPKPGPPRSPYGFVYPYQMPTAYYRPPMAPPGTIPGAPAPAWGAPQASPAARPPWRFCIMCGRRIPGEAKFCPYCRHAYTA